MKKKKFDISDAESLRKKAEELLKKKFPSGATILNPEADVLKLIHELQVYQIEIELQNEEREMRAEELAIANKELVFQNEEKAKRASELAIANKELKFQNEEKAKRADELVTANKELVFQNEEKIMRAEELLIANEELKYQNEEKAKRAEELAIARKEVEHQAVILSANKELMLSEHRLKGRNKELQALYGLSKLADYYDVSNESLFRALLNIIKGSWQYPEITCSRIVINGAEYCTENFAETDWKLSEPIKADGKVIGRIDILYLEKSQEADEGPFLNEERNLINAVAERMGIIIERKRVEDKKRKDDAIIRKLSTAIEQSPVSIVITDIKGNIEFVNPMFTELTGYKFEEAVGRNPRILKSGNKSKNEYKELWDTILSGKNWEGTFLNKKKSGELYYESATISPVKNEAGEIIHFLALKQDITERKRIDDELNRQSAFINSLIDSIPDVIFFKDKEGVYLGCNPASIALIGKPKEEIIGKTNYDFFNKELADGLRENDLKTMEQNTSMRYEEWITNKDISVLFETIKTPYLDSNGEVIGIIGISRDITEKKKSEAEIKLKNEELVMLNSEKDKFFSIIAHDLRGPFSGFLGLTNIFASEFSEMKLDEMQKLALLMKDSAVNLFRLLENLLEWSQMKRGLTVVNPEQFSIDKIISGSIILIKEIAAKKEITISSDVQEELQVYADINMFEAAVRNLLSNALKFTSKGGSVTLSANSTTDNKVEVSVKDTGIGMNKERMDGLFRLDVNTNRKGTEGEPSTGLGLHICKEFIEKNGGEITVESEEGKGTTFKFTVPLFDETAVESQAEQSVKMNRGGINNLTVLIAEDDNISAKLLASLVRKFSKETLYAKTGIEAVEICRNNPDIDLVLMDIKMPDTDGFEATRQIREFNKDVVIIAQTAFALSGHEEKAKEAGFNDTITKIFDFGFLEEIIGKYIR
ncbi:MAG: PAS domain S-box protein [Ignavibacteria bacterium]